MKPGLALEQTFIARLAIVSVAVEQTAKALLNYHKTKQKRKIDAVNSG